LGTKVLIVFKFYDVGPFKGEVVSNSIWNTKSTVVKNTYEEKIASMFSVHCSHYRKNVQVHWTLSRIQINIGPFFGCFFLWSIKLYFRY